MCMRLRVGHTYPSAYIFPLRQSVRQPSLVGHLTDLVCMRRRAARIHPFAAALPKASTIADRRAEPLPSLPFEGAQKSKSIPSDGNRNLAGGGAT